MRVAYKLWFLFLNVERCLKGSLTRIVPALHRKVYTSESRFRVIKPLPSNILTQKDPVKEIIKMNIGRSFEHDR